MCSTIFFFYTFLCLYGKGWKDIHIKDSGIPEAWDSEFFFNFFMSFNFFIMITYYLCNYNIKTIILIKAKAITEI